MRAEDDVGRMFRAQRAVGIEDEGAPTAGNIRPLSIAFVTDKIDFIAHLVFKVRDVENLLCPTTVGVDEEVAPTGIPQSRLPPRLLGHVAE